MFIGRVGHYHNFEGGEGSIFYKKLSSILPKCVIAFHIQLELKKYIGEKKERKEKKKRKKNLNKMLQF